jgi:hypothetical protein
VGFFSSPPHPGHPPTHTPPHHAVFSSAIFQGLGDSVERAQLWCRTTASGHNKDKLLLAEVGTPPVLFDPLFSFRREVELTLPTCSLFLLSSLFDFFPLFSVASFPQVGLMNRLRAHSPSLSLANHHKPHSQLLSVLLAPLSQHTHTLSLSL